MKLAGMTGTASTEADEFSRIYDLSVVEIPTNRPIARTDNSDVVFSTKDGALPPPLLTRHHPTAWSPANLLWELQVCFCQGVIDVERLLRGI